MIRPFLIAALLFAPFLVKPAAAQDYKTILDIPEGQTLVNLSASERVEVEQDLLVATLNYNTEDDDPRALQDRINTLMAKAVEKAKAYKDVKVTTQQYYVYPYDYDPHPRPYTPGEPPRKLERKWRGQQGLSLESKKAGDLLKLTGELQEMGLAMNGLNYTLSTELLESTQESLLEAALKKLTAKADRTAKALGKTKADLREVNVDMGGYYPQPMMRTMAMEGAAMAMDAKMAAPVAQPGQSDITMTVSARVLLK